MAGLLKDSKLEGIEEGYNLFNTYLMTTTI